MDNYLYINDKPMDFICNGVPSHLEKGMKVKERLINYMVEKHPDRISKIGDVKAVRDPLPETLVTRAPVKESVKAVSHEEKLDIELESLSNFYAGISQDKADVTEDDAELCDPELMDDVDTILENVSSKTKKFDIGNLKTYKNIKFMSREEMDSVCNQLNIEYTSKVATAKNIAKLLDIPVK